MKANEFLSLLESEGLEESLLPRILVDRLIEKGRKIATAESCTGGLVSSAIVSVTGASQAFDCGVCSYANFIKNKVLGVREDTLSSYGAVSEKTAQQMARGVRLLSGADLAVSTTGIAGPDGGSQLKPVGLVYVGVSTEMGLRAEKLLLAEGGANDRQRIRELAASAALYFALKEVEHF